MAIFDILPSVQKCCCCIPLRAGSQIIGYIGVFLFLHITSYMVSYLSWQSHHTEPKTDLSHEFALFKMLLDYIFSFFSIILLLGIAQENEAALMMWLYAALSHIIVSVINTYQDFIVAVQCFKGIFCYDKALNWCYMFSFVATPFVMFYFMIVVKSYLDAGFQSGGD